METKKNKTILPTVSYRDTLEPVVRARYEEKLKIIGGTDPYELNVKTTFSDEKKLLPSVTYPDIVNYLLFSPSPYTTDDLKSLKGLEAYNQAQNGWVSDVKAVVIGSKHVIRSKVLHSMRLRDKPLNPWSIVEPNGVILASHCDCMAGLGEVCTHIAAMLFTVMEIVRIRDSTTVTQDPAYWKLPPSMKRVEYKEVRNMDFTSAKSLKRKFDRVLESGSNENSNALNETPAKKADKEIPKPTNDEIKDFLQNLHATGAKPSILSVIEEYSDEYVPTIEKQQFPRVLTDLKEKDALFMNYGDLLKHISSDKIIVNVSSEEVVNVELATREQSGTKLWHDFRAGRVTASVAKQACSTDPANPSQSLIMSICYPNAKKLDTDATRWGLKHEKVAKERFISALKSEGLHQNVKLNECGLYLSEDNPYIAATPDAILSCDCCGQSVVEIKCPYNQRKEMLDCEQKDFYLKLNDNGTLSLDKKHQYYYQVQTQLGVTKLQSAYFIVMTEVDTHIEEILFDDQLWKEICCRAEKFFNVAILPELVGKFYSRLPGCGMPTTDTVLTESEKATTSNDKIDTEEERWCYCDQVESGEMIACDNENCKIVWFHFTCLKLDKPPKCSKWFCPDCRKLPEFKKSRAKLNVHRK